MCTNASLHESHSLSRDVPCLTSTFCNVKLIVYQRYKMKFITCDK